MSDTDYIRLMMKKIRDYIQKYNMITPGETIVAGVSGGADSVCLLLVLLELKKEIEFDIRVVHINHGIRPEAVEDADYVKTLCERNNLTFTLVEENIKVKAQKEHISEEEAGRKVRYQAFERELVSIPYEKGKIAVAHHKNDRAETVLFHLFRGTGIAGMGGIKPVRGRVIRPLLCLERKEIEEYLNDKNVSFCIDCTNEEDNYTRNRIRHHIMEYAENQVCEKSVEHITDAAEMFEETELYLEKVTNAAFEQIVEIKNGKVMINSTLFLKEEGLIQKRILLKAIETLVPYRKNFTSVHIREVQDLFLKKGSKEVHLPYDLAAYHQYDKVLICKKEKHIKSSVKTGIGIQVPGKLFLGDGKSIEFALISYDKSKNIPQKIYTKWLDYDRIKKSLVLRTRETGDFLTFNDKLSRKTLKQYMIDEKVPKEYRDNLWLLTDDKHVVWVIGYRISEYYKVNEETQKILEVRFKGGTEDV